ncbi:MAG: hypothetical protein WDZ88_01105 [Candidatus Paceibacterota bacterium]
MNILVRYKFLFAVLLVFILIQALFFFISPSEIVSSVGIENSYGIAFLVALIGGVSTLTGPVLFATIATFSAGGANPFLLGLVGGLGIFISNSVFYFLALYGKKSVSEKWKEKLNAISERIKEKYSKRVIFPLVYLYLSFTPLSDDVLMVGLVIAGYRYMHIAPLLLLGGISFATATAFFGNLFV